MKIINFPLSKIIIGHLLGVLIAYFTKPSIVISLCLLAGFFIVFVVVFLLAQKNTKKSSLFTLAAIICSVIIGITTVVIQTESNDKNHYTKNPLIFEKENIFRITILEKIKPSKKNQRFVAQINMTNRIKTTGKVLINISKNSNQKNIETGTQLVLKGRLIKNKKASNPGQFDYSTYLENQQIYSQLYLKQKTYIITPLVKKNIGYYISRIRTSIIENLEKTDFGENERNVALALILGQKQEISPEIMQDYQYAGAIHILSVSGLHIGYIMLFLNFLMQPIANNRKGLLVKLIITISFLWLFALIAGLSPSVVRSVIMFSFVTIGYYFRRGKNTYYVMLVSIYIILLFQPYFLFDIGFQLSYLALFFIVWLQPLLASIWQPKNKLAIIIWNILTVSTAAQIGTLPLSLYYFHQFPALFFITNLIVSPFLIIIMFIGIVVMILAGFGSTPYLLIKPLEWSIYGMDYCINWIASYKNFVLQDISFNTYLLISVYFCIVTIIIWIQKPQFNKLIYLLISIICLQLSWIQTKHNFYKKEELIVFNQNSNTMITIRKGQKVELLSNDSIIKNASKNTTLKSYLTANFSIINKKTTIKNSLYFNKTKILIIDKTGIYPNNAQPDILLLTQSPTINFERLLLTLNPKIVIADASNYKSLQSKWKKTCQKKAIKFHFITEEGFCRL